VRWKWEPGSVAFWDNRVVAHRAVPGGYNPEEREGKRTCVYGEKPFFDKENGVALSDYKGKPQAGVGKGANRVFPESESNGVHEAHTTNGTNGVDLSNGSRHVNDAAQVTNGSTIKQDLAKVVDSEADINETNLNVGP